MRRIARNQGGEIVFLRRFERKVLLLFGRLGFHVERNRHVDDIDGQIFESAVGKLGHDGLRFGVDEFEAVLVDGNVELIRIRPVAFVDDEEEGRAVKEEILH